MIVHVFQELTNLMMGACIILYPALRVARRWEASHVPIQ
jgi:hypothetical protein